MAPHHRPPTQARSIPSSSQPISLTKRLLFPSLTTNDLPPLLASPNVAPELTTELYDFIALALRAHVNPWWTKITRYDKEFLPEITRILIVVIQALETRILATDLPPLVFRDVPTILTQHYRDYRNAASKLSTSYASGGAASLPQLFHQLQPHMAISPDGRVDPEYFRQVVDHILKVCLPLEDYAPEAERFVVREIIIKVILNDVIPKLTQPWFIHKMALDLSGLSSEPVEPQEPPSSFSFHTLLIVLLSAIQSLSGACLALIHAYKQTLSTIKLINQTQTPHNSPIPSGRSAADQASSPTTRLPSHLPSLSISSMPSVSSSLSSPTTPLAIPPPPMLSLSLHQNYAGPPLTMLSEILTTHNRFSSTTILSFTSLITSSMTPFIDRLLSHLLTSFLSQAFILNTTRIAKHALFPNGFPGPTPPDPTLEEQAKMRARLIEWRPKGALTHLMPYILGPDPPATLSTALDPFDSAPCNAHLILVFLDRIMMSLFPELIGTTPDGDPTAI